VSASSLQPSEARLWSRSARLAACKPCPALLKCRLTPDSWQRQMHVFSTLLVDPITAASPLPLPRRRCMVSGMTRSRTSIRKNPRRWSGDAACSEPPTAPFQRTYGCYAEVLIEWWIEILGICSPLLRRRSVFSRHKHCVRASPLRNVRQSWAHHAACPLGLMKPDNSTR